jgi:isoamylase
MPPKAHPRPLGVTYLPEERAYNFALYTKHATAVTLLLYSETIPPPPRHLPELQFPRNKRAESGTAACPSPASNAHAITLIRSTVPSTSPKATASTKQDPL